MTNYYAVEAYATPALAKAAIDVIETTTTFTVVPYREGAHAKFLVITPASNKPM